MPADKDKLSAVVTPLDHKNSYGEVPEFANTSTSALPLFSPLQITSCIDELITFNCNGDGSVISKLSVVWHKFISEIVTE